jgi:hypothetical protein
VTDYLSRVDDLLRTGICIVEYLNATRYSVNAVIMTQLAWDKFKVVLGRHAA